MTNAAALKTIKSLAKKGQILLGGHARDRMTERGVRFADIKSALVNAVSVATADEPGRWAAVTVF